MDVSGQSDLKILKLPNGKFRIQKPKGPELFDGPPNEPRDWHGRWTSGGIGQGGPNVASGISPQKKAEIEARKNQSGKNFSDKIKVASGISSQKKEEIESRKAQSEKSFREKLKNSTSSQPESFTEIGKEPTYEQMVKIKEFSNNFRGYSREEATSLYKYMVDSDFFNNSLRTGDVYALNEKESQINYLDSAISRNKVPNDINVYRGILDFSEALKIPEGSSAVGYTISDRGYTSTSINAHISTYSFSERSSPNVFRIKVPKGTNAAFINSDESEVLLGRESKYKITGYSEKNGIKIYDAEIIK